MMQQLSLAIDSHAPLKRSSLDLPIVRSHAIKIFNSMSRTITSGIRPTSPEDSYPGAEFLFGGYAWGKKKFELWRIHFDQSINGFAAAPASFVGYSAKAGTVRIVGGKKSVVPASIIAFAGDQAGAARSRLRALLEARHSRLLHEPLNWEPLEVVRDMLRDPAKSHTIGGPPQILKVHQYPVSEPIGVRWTTDVTAGVFLQGRECLGYERIERFVIDPDTLLTSAPFVPLGSQGVS